MMLRQLWRLTWLEFKIYVREPLGVIGGVAIPVLIFVLLGRTLGPAARGSSNVPRIAADLLLFTALTLALMVMAGRRYYPVDAGIPLASFTLALLVSTVSILSLGFLIAS